LALKETPMQYALDLPPFGELADARALAALAHEAEDAGWDGFFIWDHIQTEPSMPVADPWVALSALAMTTERIRLGALVTPLPRRRPWKLARETVTLDRLSNGRLILGVGIGSDHWHHELSTFGEPVDDQTRAAMLDEGLEVLTGLWSGEPFSHQGQHYTVQSARFLPMPVQSPRIPIWVAGIWPRKAPLRRALGRRLPRRRGTLHAAGRDPRHRQLHPAISHDRRSLRRDSGRFRRRDGSRRGAGTAAQPCGSRGHVVARGLLVDRHTRFRARAHPPGTAVLLLRWAVMNQ
jgi:alkanesulfonate monooxygenase SsuD/methylene tetrahydromethanopterin reductase-like flavin-dependent oxidoreductase (luciferase family)